MADAPFGALAPGFVPSQPDQSQTALAMLLQARAQLAGQPSRAGLPDVGEPLVGDGGQFSPGTAVGNKAADIASRMAYGAGTGLATLPRRALEASAADVGHLGEPGYEPQSIAPAVETALTMMGGSGAVPAEANELRMGIKAYHGSPHDFDAFDLSKIGTGEGAQAYGHGLYFAENEGTAKSYRDSLAPRHSKPPEELASIPHDQFQAIMTHALEDQDSMTAAKRAQYMSAGLRQEDQSKIADLIDRVRASRQGKMYEVNINADPAHFLDYDAALAADHPARAKLKELAQMGVDSHEYGVDRQLAKDAFVAADNPTLTGNGLYRQMTNAVEAARPALKAQGNPKALFGGTAPMANDELVKAGIPGIKYLDQGSRNPGFSSLKPAQLDARIESLRTDLASGGGDQQRMSEQLANLERERETYRNVSHNYVVFNDKLIDIMRKYGLAGLPAAGVAGAAASDQAPFGALGR